MRLATLRTAGGTRAARLDGYSFEVLDAPDAGALLQDPYWRNARGTQRIAAADAKFAPVVPNPRKIICLGLNYRSHIEEMGRIEVTNPTLFAKYAVALIAACVRRMRRASSRG
jgi:acylpyruvate hydrolase